MCAQQGGAERDGEKGRAHPPFFLPLSFLMSVVGQCRDGSQVRGFPGHLAIASFMHLKGFLVRHAHPWLLPPVNTLRLCSLWDLLTSLTWWIPRTELSGSMCAWGDTERWGHAQCTVDCPQAHTPLSHSQNTSETTKLFRFQDSVKPRALLGIGPGQLRCP